MQDVDWEMITSINKLRSKILNAPKTQRNVSVIIPPLFNENGKKK